jgi:hypothetical protein
MTHHNTAETATVLQNKDYWPSVGSLSAREFRTFPDRNCKDRGVWLEIFCPDDRCFSEEERIKLVEFCEDSGKKKDRWDELFCPESSCEIFEASQLP